MSHLADFPRLPHAVARRPLLSLDGVQRIYPASPPVKALREATFDVLDGEVVAIVGRSGSGKSTLLNVLGLLDVPTGGEYRVGGCPVSGLSDRDQTLLRSRFFGFVFQQSFLLPNLSAQENVELGLRPRGVPAAERRRRSIDALARVGLSHRRRFLPARMSGGECQRVAIARAIAQEPRVLLCDEPTGNLDEGTSAELLQTLLGTDRGGAAVIMVTHDMGIAQSLPRTLSVRDGIVSEGDGRLLGSESPVKTSPTTP